MQPMTKEQIFEQVQGILVDSFELDRSNVRLTAHLIDDLDFDSIDVIDLAVELEKEAGFEVSEAELREIRFVHDIVELIYRHLQAA